MARSVIEMKGNLDAESRTDIGRRKPWNAGVAREQ
jgi:hypothetical protein